MPRLVYFAPCLMPIISQEGILSLVNLVERIAVPATSQDAALPPITAVAYFRREGGDAGKSFELKLRITGPSGTLLRERVTNPFEITDEGHRYLIAIHDFPVAEAGTHGLHLFLREHGADASWLEVAEYPVDIAHTGTPE
jgi:hypothetical protein